MRRLALVGVGVLAACSSKQVDLPAPVTPPSTVTSAALASTASPAAQIPAPQDHAVRAALMDLATAQESVFTDTGAYLAFQGAVPSALAAAGFHAELADVVLGASTPTKDTYCLIAVYQPTDAFELYHSEGTPGLAGSASDVPADCNALVAAVVARAQRPTSVAAAQSSVLRIVAAERARKAPLSFSDPVPSTLPVKVDEASFLYGVVARSDRTFCVVAVLRSSLDYITYDSAEGRFLPGGGPTPEDCSQLADALAGVSP